jgi:hypothetical protein
MTPLEFIEKRPPQKALCLGPPPPPWREVKFIDFLRFLPKIGPSMQPEKPSLKSASTPYPPQKVVQNVIFSEIYRFFTIFPFLSVFLIIRDPLVLNLIFTSFTIGNINYQLILFLKIYFILNH